MQLKSYSDNRGNVYKIGAGWPGTKRNVTILGIEVSPELTNPDLPEDMVTPAHDVTVIGQEQGQGIAEPIWIGQFWLDGAGIIFSATAEEFQQMQAVAQAQQQAAQAAEAPSTPEQPQPEQPEQESAL